ncbi:dihydrofolate reductase [Nocardioides caricicola]|uniref:Dihydrofolate reductase n=1 Tax=Nocardioides caricicola TaxID=634770 RepID=A0ABW0N755_9ACTN
MSKRIILVAAVARNGVIGNGSDIPWKIPGEQAEFKALTMGHVLVMGRTTYESIGRPLPGRTTIVLTRDRSWSADGVLVAHSFLDALGKAASYDGEVIVVGGAQVYAEALPLAAEQIISEVPLEPEGDVFYPDFDRNAWLETDREHFDGYERVWLERAANRL